MDEITRGWSPLSGNPLRTRDDAARAVSDLFEPLLPHWSPALARVRLGSAGAHFSATAADLEGWARPLWGLVPLAAGGGAFEHWERYRRGLVHGTDPGHEEHWGPLGHNQRQVEASALGFALALAPEHLWDPLAPAEQRQVAAWLDGINHHDLDQNNHQWFRVMVDLGLRRVGHAFDESKLDEALAMIDGWYETEGWYRDGWLDTHDHYVPLALHFYGLVYAHLAGDEDPERATRLCEHAREFAQHYRCWFDDAGRAIPYGRSMTYRFALAAFWGALALVDDPGLDPGELRRLVLSHLRWWSGQPIARPDGVLTLGYAYEQPLLAEEYSSPGSPYWCMKAFLPLLLGDAHPFWSAPEPGPIGPQPTHVDRVIGARIGNDGAQAVLLNAGQANNLMRQSPAKYGKLAYSSAFGFSVESDHRHTHHLAADSALAVCDGPGEWRVRDRVDAWQVLDDGRLWTRWRPWPDVIVETLLDGGAPWHTRVHRIETKRPMHLVESGFAIGWDGADAATGGVERVTGERVALARSDAGTTVVVDQLGQRQSLVIAAAPNTNLMASRTLIPAMSAPLYPGEHWFACAVGAAERPGLDPTGAPPLAVDAERLLLDLTRR